MSSLIMHSAGRAILDAADLRGRQLLAHPCWQFPSLFSHYPGIAGTSQDIFSSLLQEREHAMGAATLSARSITLLFRLLEQMGIALTTRSFLWHEPGITAREKQLVLPPHVTVLKTVTVMMATHLFLWTTIGDRRIARADVQHIATMFGLSNTAAARSIINPSSIDPEEAFGIRVGMVSPFLPPGRSTALSAVVFANQHQWNVPADHFVAVSLSRYESLLVPFHHFPQVLQEYVRHAYPQPVIERRNV